MQKRLLVDFRGGRKTRADLPQRGYPPDPGLPLNISAERRRSS
jgi:hypothetical protein